MLRYSQLTGAERKFLCNGCGGKGSWLRPPQWIFAASCNHHDFHYWRGCTETDRFLADRAFYRKMRQDVAASPWYLRPLRHLGALSYYLAVRRFGREHFHHGPRMRGAVALFEQMNAPDPVRPRRRPQGAH